MTPVRTANVLADGSPLYLEWTESWLVGGAMLASAEDVVNAATVCGPEDFRDRSLGLIWDVLPGLSCPCAAHVAAVLTERGQIDEVGAEPRLVELAGSQNAFLYAGRAALEAHAGIVREWGEKRRRLADLGEHAKAIYESGVSNVTPIRAVGVRSAFGA